MDTGGFRIGMEWMIFTSHELIQICFHSEIYLLLNAEVPVNGIVRILEAKSTKQRAQTYAHRESPPPFGME